MFCDVLNTIIFKVHFFFFFIMELRFIYNQHDLLAIYLLSKNAFPKIFR